MKAFSPILSALSLAMLLTACRNDKMQTVVPAGGCDTGSAAYTAVILPLTNQHCAISGCHVDGGDNAGNIDLSTYGGLKAVADDGSLLNSMRGIAGYSQMPLNAQKLDDCTIAKYAKWVAKGAPQD